MAFWNKKNKPVVDQTTAEAVDPALFVSGALRGALLSLGKDFLMEDTGSVFVLEYPDAKIRFSVNRGAPVVQSQIELTKPLPTDQLTDLVVLANDLNRDPIFGSVDPMHGPEGAVVQAQNALLYSEGVTLAQVRDFVEIVTSHVAPRLCARVVDTFGIDCDPQQFSTQAQSPDPQVMETIEESVIAPPYVLSSAATTPVTLERIVASPAVSDLELSEVPKEKLPEFVAASQDMERCLSFEYQSLPMFLALGQSQASVFVDASMPAHDALKYIVALSEFSTSKALIKASFADDKTLVTGTFYTAGGLSDGQLDGRLDAVINQAIHGINEAFALAHQSNE